jgi:hypothetical protein
MHGIYEKDLDLNPLRVFVVVAEAGQLQQALTNRWRGRAGGSSCPREGPPRAPPDGHFKSGSHRARGSLPPGVSLPQAGEEGASEASQAGVSKEPKKERTPRVDWAELLRRTFAFDVFACMRCGGRRRVLAYVKGAAGVSAILEHLGWPTASAHLAPARGPPQSAGC